MRRPREGGNSLNIILWIGLTTLAVNFSCYKFLTVFLCIHLWLFHNFFSFPHPRDFLGGISKAIMLFTKAESGGTNFVWFYDVKADGLSLDDKWSPLLSEDKQGAVPTTPLTEEEHSKNNLPDVLRRWRLLASTTLSHRKSSSLSKSKGL